ncbi:peptidoglycan-binding protein [Cohaesibacter sp. ES.047]|uniref:peptidoglycan-binding protein n=1 Tax=Cohaesibacter sp. ES.047 TaxID=1798205 RepID=UPI0015615CD5|nr:peptidoglycan-binding protein [Cohaesibacter sp. ES.047]
MRELSSVNPLLAAITLRAAQICEQPFQVTNGIRSLEDQVRNLERGASKTLASTHLIGIADDLHATSPDGAEILWEPLSLYQTIQISMKQAASEFGVKLKWGGDWGWDSVHFQLSTSKYGPSLGLSGQAVVNCQRLLNLVSPEPLEVDGHFGQITDKAVRGFQASVKLPVTGIVNYPTLKKLIPAFERSL